MTVFPIGISLKRLPPAGYANESEAVIILAESLEHRQCTPKEDALLELLIQFIGRAKFLNLVKAGSKTNFTTPVGPFRCLVIINSVISRSGVSGL